MNAEIAINQHGWTRFFTVTATTKDENILIRHSFAGYFQINQHGWTKIFNVTATTKDENSPERYHFVVDFRIKRTAKRAREFAWRSGTPVVIYENGVIREEREHSITHQEQ